MMIRQKVNELVEFLRVAPSDEVRKALEERQQTENQERRKAAANEMEAVDAALLVSIEALAPKLDKAKAAVERTHKAHLDAQEAHWLLLNEESNARSRADHRKGRLEAALRGQLRGDAAIDNCAPPDEVRAAKGLILEMEERLRQDNSLWPRKTVKVVVQGIARNETVTDTDARDKMQAALGELRVEADALVLYGGADIVDKAAAIVERGRAVMEGRGDSIAAAII